MAGPRRLDAHERALRLLSVRPRSRRELRDRLLRAGFEAAEVEGELERLESAGLVDDERFARELAAHQLSVRRSGRRAVAGHLAAKGVDRAVIAEVLAEAAGGDEERARELARARADRLRGLPQDTAFARLVSFLVRRGHQPEDARRAAREALEIDPAVE